MNNKWELNGPSLWMNPSKKHYQMYLEDLQEHHHWMHDYVEQYDEFIKKHRGERLYFFRDAKDYFKWTKEDLGMKDTEMPPEFAIVEEPMACFFENNGQPTGIFKDFWHIVVKIVRVHYNI